MRILKLGQTFIKSAKTVENLLSQTQSQYLHFVAKLNQMYLPLMFGHFLMSITYPYEHAHKNHLNKHFAPFFHPLTHFS